MNNLSSQEFLQINVGTKNHIKVAAVREVIANYNCLARAEVIGISVESGIKKQPTTFEETIKGAKNRALRAYQENCLSIGMESGLMEMPTVPGEYMDVCICSIYDGERHHIGMSSGYLLPKKVSILILREGVDLNEAMQRCGFTDNPKLGAAEGSIGLFTGGRISRKDNCKQSFIAAFSSIEQKQYFEEGQGSRP